MKKAMSRRRFLEGSGAAALSLAARPKVALAPPRFDLVLKGGTILDGTGAPAYPGDVGIVGDRIAAIGDIALPQAARVVDVRGLQVCPGFIDIHTHSDGDILAYPTADSRVRQGITTELTGNCGSSVAPLLGPIAEERRSGLRRDGIEPDWTDVAGYFARVERERVSINHAMLLGQGTLRECAAGVADRPLSADETKAVLRAVEEGMEQGAFGLSTGLEYTPGRFTPTDEIVAMARLVARRGGLYTSHIRNEERGLLEATDEAIRIGRLAGVRVEVSHVKASGRGNWGKQSASLALIEAGRRDGVEVLGDAYPYTAYSTGLTVTFPGWSLDGGTPAVLARLRGAERERIRKEVLDYVLNGDPGDFALIVISSVQTTKNRRLVGKNLAEVAADWKVEPVEALLRLVDEEDTAVSYVGHGMSPDNVARVLQHPLLMIGSDGSTMAPTGRAAETRPHPRSYGTYPRVLGYYARERHLFDLPTAVRKMTSLPADQIGLRDRGRLARGKKADVVVFDAATVIDVATFEDPHRYPVGIVYVLVNGVPVVERGAHTGARPGQVLRFS
jgi:N-acyl-D-aspartate/D-glutamate deacylase